MTKCKNCGKKIPKNTTFCPYCGAKQISTAIHKSNSVGGTNYTTDNDYKKRIKVPDAIKAKPGQQTWKDFYGKHRILLLVISLILIIIIVFGGIKFGVKAYHNYEYPESHLPPSIAGRNYSFQNGTHLLMNKNRFTYVSDGSDNTEPNGHYRYHVMFVRYQKPYIYVGCNYINYKDNPQLNGGNHYSQWKLQVKGHSIESEQPLGGSAYDDN